MKKLLLTLILLLSLCLLFSCKIGGSDDGSGSGQPSGDSSSGDSSSGDSSGGDSADGSADGAEKGSVYLIAGNGATAEAISALSAGLTSLGYTPITQSGSVPEGSLTVILGDLDSEEASRIARKRLERVEREEYFDARYLVYSNGDGRVAISFDTYTEPSVAVSAAGGAADAFLSKATAAFSGAVGTLTSGEIDLVALQNEIDNASLEEQWQTVFEEAGGDERARILTDSLREFYSIYGDNLIIWLADLYDPESGGFYYSNSARDTEGYLPDIESTAQVLDNLRENGMFDYVDNNLMRALPEWFRSGIIKFIKSKQSPNGYFYHPQWSEELTNTMLSRRGRDLTKGVSALKTLGAKPTYDTPLGDKGDGIDADGNPVADALPASKSITGRLGAGKASAASKVIAVSGVLVPSHLVSDVTFKEWLSTQDLNGDSYTVGNYIAAQTPEIIGRDKVLKADGKPYLLSQILIDWFNEHCYATTGHWNSVADYEGTNGFLKISDCYNQIAKSGLGVDASLPYPEKALESSVAALITEEYASTVCYTYNVWFNICNIFDNVTYSDPEAGEALAKETRAMLLDYVTEDVLYNGLMLNAITISKLKTMEFLKNDSSFSFSPGHSAATSQGMQVAVPNTNEGDINGTNLCSTGIVSRMFAALGLPHPQLFTRADAMCFLRKLEELGPVIKDEEIVYNTGNLSFDDMNVGDELQQITNNTPGESELSVALDPENAQNLVLRYSKRTSAANKERGQIDFQTTERKKNYNAFVLSTDMYIDYLDGENFLSSYMYGYLGTKGEQFGYEYIFSPNRQAELRFADTSHASYGKKSSTYELGIPEESWFNFRIEYYIGDADSVRIKIYVDNKLFYVSNNFYGPKTTDKIETNYEPLSSLTTFRFCVDKAFQGEVYFDNFNLYQANLVCQDHLVGTQESMPDRVPDSALDFESFDVGDTPDTVHVSSKPGTDYFSATVTDNPTGNGGKVLKNSKYNEKADGSDPVSGYAGTLKFVPHYTDPSFNAAVFSSDMYFDFNTASTVILRLGNHLNTACMVFVNRRSDGSLSFRVLSNASNPINEYFYPAAREKHWFNFRLEYYLGDSESVRLKFYINDELAYVSDNFYGPMSTDGEDTTHTPESRLTRFTVSSYGDYEGDVYFDNVSFELVQKSCTGDALGAYAHTHTNENGDVFCDKCGGVLEHECIDENHDDECDRCKKKLPHSHYDGDSDVFCDKCGEVLPHDCVDDNHDDRCDRCDKKLPHTHYDGDSDVFCDGCNEIMEHECTDGDDNLLCDRCGEAVEHSCRDNDSDVKCDICGKYMPHTHTDLDADGKCDVCDIPFGDEDSFGDENLSDNGWTKE